MDSAVTVLLIEDEPLVAMFVRDALEDGGFVVLHLSEAQAAAKAISDGIETVAALVTDIRLGDELTGWDLARLAREHRHELPIVYISGDSAIDHCAQGVPESVMIQKPFVAAQLITAIANLLNQAPVSS